MRLRCNEIFYLNEFNYDNNIYNIVLGDQVCPGDEEGGGPPHPLHGGGEGGQVQGPGRDHGRLGELVPVLQK